MKPIYRTKTGILYHGDCIKTMQRFFCKGHKADMILTDIPYGEVNRKSNGLRNLDKENADITTFDLSTFLDMSIKVFSGSCYVFCGHEQYSHIFDFFNRNKLSTRGIIWKKTNPSPMNCKHIWVSGIEMCVYGKKPKAIYNGGYQNTVLEYPSGRKKYGHPTEKPLKLFEELILKSSNENDVILDPCCGSGTTIEAAIKNNRKWVAIELDRGYCDIIIDRIKNI